MSKQHPERTFGLSMTPNHPPNVLTGSIHGTAECTYRALGVTGDVTTSRHAPVTRFRVCTSLYNTSKTGMTSHPGATWTVSYTAKHRHHGVAGVGRQRHELLLEKDSFPHCSAVDLLCYAACDLLCARHRVQAVALPEGRKKHSPTP